MTTLKRILILAAVIISFSATTLAVHAYSLDEFKQDVGNLISTGQNQGPSFTQYSTQGLQLEKKGLNDTLTQSSDIKEFVIKIVNFALGFLGLLAIIIVIYGGVLYVTAAGEDEGTQKGKKAITYALIGLIIIIASYAIVNTVIQGASVGTEGEKKTTIGANSAPSFNAAAIQVNTLAKEIYTGFVLFGETMEEIKNIVNDANKSSLSYLNDGAVNFVSKNNIVNFLYSVKEKLLNIRSKLEQFAGVYKFSGTYLKVSDLVRQADDYIDEIQSLNETVNAKISTDGATLTQCEEPPAEEEKKDCHEYTKGLFEKWTAIKKDLISNDDKSPKSLNYLVEPMKNDYVKSAIGTLQKIKDLKDSFFSIEKNDPIDALYSTMMNIYGYDPQSPNGPYEANSFLYEISQIKAGDNQDAISKAADLLIQAIKKQIELQDALTKVQSVEAHLKANVVEGNAPLVVVFDVLDSIDPAGGAILDSNIIWDNITGKATYDGKNEVDLSQAVECIMPSDKQFSPKVFGPAFRQCTFHYPGTYIATVKVKSRDQGKYTTGMSSLVIKVKPPTTKINLKIKAGNKNIPVMSYYDNGILKLDRDYIPVTLAEAKNGLVFDATETTKTENVTNFKWDFGNGKTIDGDDTYGQQTMSFDNEGRYSINLQVMNKLGELSAKTFILDARKVAARIQITPAEKLFIGSPVIIDGGMSSASGGNIKSYEWKLYQIAQGETKPIDLGGDVNKISFMYKFKEPGKYTVSLKVSSELESVDAEPYTFTVQSKSPVALFENNVSRPSEPGIVNFDASKSFDPDGINKSLVYKWTLTPDSNNGEVWGFINGTTSESKNPIIKFKKKGNYQVGLKVTDSSTVGVGILEESGETAKNMEIKNILNISWDENQVVTSILNKEGKAPMDFKIKSDNAIAYEIDFGDGEKSSGDMKLTKTIPHTYLAGGKYSVKVTVYDSEDNDNSIEKRIFIGGGDSPLAKAAIFINGVQILDEKETIIAHKKDIITFDGSESKNLDGTGKNLRYNWDFGNEDKSSNKTATYSYKELSPKDAGYYTAKLQVYDKDDPKKISSDEVKIKVINSPPTFSSIQVIPDTANKDMVTPVNVDVKVFGDEDKDGSITQYKWWYYDLDDPSEPLGLQITTGPTAKIIIGTHGKENKEVTYAFGLEVTDSDNISVKSEDILNKEQIPKIKVTNGPNVLPSAKFSVSQTKVFVNDKVVFTSSSKDPDGKIKQYIWDFDGDGFFNDKPTELSTVEHTYAKKNLSGYDVRLKVVDDKAGEAVSDPIKIYIDSLSKPPVAAFTFKVVEGSGGKKVKFINNSTADSEGGAKIVKYIWDFDTQSNLPTADSDGNGKKDDDADSTDKEPERLYTESNAYNVKLTVTDDQGGTNSVTNPVTVPLANPPKAAFTYEVKGDSVAFKNNSEADAQKGAKIIKYIWDFSTLVDMDGDGKTDNDKDSTEKEPTYKYPVAGTYKVKLTVIDDQGGETSVVNDVKFISGVGSGTGAIDITTGPSGQIILPQNSGNLLAVLHTNPTQGKDGIIYLTGNVGAVTFDFSKSTGSISEYIFDKNIYFDTDGNTVKDDDVDFKTNLPGTWKTNFDKSWGKIVVRLTVVDIYGNTNSINQEIKFK
ncbi:PKD domain-containing protein [Candidatus Peregrinibacteria bacterium]|nr:PKD domain-containing protein [Candidatus Peregrinibacteria bacterium]